ncbi:YaiO family outer membrane beta-barrel protein [Balneola sp. MJW-20]|uniref:YaiO family outer membrane beta-barrel protein n=1 Tax=Gracilimonas aurantiaca TaxID=3234185 RepID=UPI003467DA3C
MRHTIALSLIILALGILKTTMAQVSQDPDELYRLARIEAFENKNYPKAIEFAEKALAIAPDYTELKVFLGRVYYWDGMTERALRILSDVIQSAPDQILARSSLADIYIETKQYKEAVRVLKPGIERSPTNTDFLFKAGYAEELAGDQKEAMRYYRQVEELQPTYPFLSDRIKGLGTQQYRWTATTELSYTALSNNFDPWKLGELRISRRTSLGAFGGSFQYGERFRLQDQELELFAYPVINQKTYAYLAAAFSSNEFFPEYRFGTALYRALPNRIEVGLGYNYFSFSAGNVNVINASILKFTTRYRFNARLFYALSEQNNSLTGLLYARRYIQSTNNFIELRAGYGSAAVEFNSAADIDRLNSYEAGIQGQWQFSRRFRGRLDLGYFNEEFRQNTSRNRYQFMISVDYLF